jgi:hypothetical protein
MEFCGKIIITLIQENGHFELDISTRAYPKIPQVAPEKACDALTRGFSKP